MGTRNHWNLLTNGNQGTPDRNSETIRIQCKHSSLSLQEWNFLYRSLLGLVESDSAFVDQPDYHGVRGQGDGWGCRFCPIWKSGGSRLIDYDGRFSLLRFGLSKFSDCEPCMIDNNLL